MESIDFTKSEQYTLSIRLSADGFSFSVFNPLDEGSHTFHHYKVDETLSMTANLKRAFRQLEWLRLNYRRVCVLMADKRFTLMPLELFEDEQAPLVFYHNHPKRDNEQVHYNVLRKNNTVVLFSMDKSVCNFLGEQYPHVRFHAQAGTLIEYFSIKSRQGNSRKIYVNFRKKALEVFCYDRGALLLANSFDCGNTADRVYYLLYVWKQLGFDQQRDELHLAGELTDKEALLAQLKRFVRQVFVMNPSTNLDLQFISSCE